MMHWMLMRESDVGYFRDDSMYEYGNVNMMK